MRRQRVRLAVFLLAALLSLGRRPVSSPRTEAAAEAVPFDHAAIHPGAIGIRALGDVDGDWLVDVVARNNDPGGGLPSLVWYRYPDWRRSVIRPPENSRTDELALADVDGDGDLDLVMALDEPGRVHWVANPRPDGDPAAPWPAAVQVGLTDDGEGGLSYVKDVEVADLTGDGRMDIAARTNREVFVFGQVGGGGGPSSTSGWHLATRIDIPDHEGMASGDLDLDGDADLVVNGQWIETPGGASPPGAAWAVHEIDRRWFTQAGGGWQDNNAKVAVADIDGDGRPDVLTCHSEHEGYPVLWYEAADPRAGPWIAREIVGRFDYCHTLQAADFDGDGELDVLVAQMPKSADPDEIVLMRNDGGGLGWTRQLVGTTGMYSGLAGDLGADGDVDIVGCRSWDEAPIEWWENRTRDPTSRPPDPPTATPRPRPTPGPPGTRTRDGLLAEYRFDEGEGAVALDTAGRGPPLDLHLADAAAVRWQDGALAIVAPTRLRTAGPGDRLSAAIRASGALSIEAWIAPASVDQDGPARIVSLSMDAETRNVTLGQGLWGDQPRDVYDVRLRTSATDANGTGSLTTPSGAARASLQHVVFTRAAGGARALWVDGVPVATGSQGGDLGTWAGGMPLVLANEDRVDRPWLGTFHHVALYDRALSDEEIARHFGIGPDDGPPAQASTPSPTGAPPPGSTPTRDPTAPSGSGPGRVFLPIAQHRAPAPDVARTGLERIARHPGLPLGGTSLGVADTLHAALDVEGGRIFLRSGFDRLRAVRVSADGAHLLAFAQVRVRAFLADGVLTVFDAREPSALRPIGRLDIPSVIASDAGLIRDFGPILVSLDGDRLALAAHELALIDIAERAAPRLLRRGTLPRRAMGLVGEGGMVFVAQEDGAIEAYRVR